MSISNFKLGERAPGEHPRLGDDEIDEEDLGKTCVLKTTSNITCPDPLIKFYLYSGEDPRRRLINTSSEEWIEEAFFQTDKPTVLLMHGYQGGENLMPTVILREAYIKNGSYNLITADYPALVKERCDRFARLSAESIAKCTAHLLDYFSHFGVGVETFSCVGFSLGAHICGLVANFVGNTMDKIIALDPSGGRQFRRYPTRRLDESDALSVHAIHTDTWRYGEGEAIGTADVCVNNGRQPFCKRSINNQHLCSHASSVCFFAESLFPEYEREVEPCFKRCPRPIWHIDEPEGDNATFGASMDHSASGMFCLNTDEAPFCPPTPDSDFGDPRCCIWTRSRFLFRRKLKTNK